MNMDIRPVTPEERKYSYTQSQDIIRQAGCLGHLRAYLDAHGSAFYSCWEDHDPELKTDRFTEEFNAVVDMLRFDERFGHALKNCGTLAAYCYSHPDSSFGPDSHDFGFRVDTRDYAYMLRLTPRKGEYNVYIYSYLRDRLEEHMKRTEEGGVPHASPDR